MAQSVSVAVYALSTLIGIAAFVYPFCLPYVPPSASMGQAHSHDAPLLLIALVGVSLVAVMLEVQSHTAGAKRIALAGMLVSTNAMLRFAEVAMPGPGGFSPVFFLIVVSGYVYGARFGFLMGAMTLLVSALITAGVGSWLPYQMYTAGWVGMTAPLCRPLVRWLGGQGKWREVLVLAGFSGGWGLLYGAIMNIWFWPFAVGPVEQHWRPGMTVTDLLRHYALFYLATSFAWDMMRLAGNIILTVSFGLPTLRAMRRFQSRFEFSQSPVQATVPPGQVDHVARQTSLAPDARQAQSKTLAGL